MEFTLPIDSKANVLLGRSPLALLIGMVLDQQVPLEKAFTSPYELAERLGHDPDVRELAEYDTDALITVFAQRPALHRFPKAMAARVQEMCREIVESYDADPASVWTGAATGAELRQRVGSLPGFGAQKAQIFVALLGKQGGVQPEGWREAAGKYGEDGAYRSVADITDDDSLRAVRTYKQEMKAAAKRS